MTNPKSLEALAKDTWPLFERKLRRVRLQQKVNKWLLWTASGLALVGLLFVLFAKQPAKRKKDSKKAPAIQAPVTINKRAFSQEKLTQLPLFMKPADQATLRQRFVLEECFVWPSLKDFKPLAQSLSNSAFIYRADLPMACAQLNIQPLTWSLQSNGHSLSALIDEQTLMIMNLMYGTDVLAEYPTDFNNESFYRPAFFPADQFVHIAFYEVGEWIQDPLTVRLNMNRMSDNVRIAPWLVSSNSVRNIDGTNMLINAFDRVSPGVFLYRGLNPSFYRSSMQQYRKNLFVADRPPTAFNPLLFHRADTLIAVTAQAQRITKLSMYGLVCGSKEITYKSKGIHSFKRLEPILDPVNNTLYVLAPTNFHFVIYQVDLNSGVAQQVFQTPSVWKGAEFEISAGQLTYNYKGKLITVSLP
jgi:hypothetical protein